MPYFRAMDLRFTPDTEGPHIDEGKMRTTVVPFPSCTQELLQLGQEHWVFVVGFPGHAAVGEHLVPLGPGEPDPVWCALVRRALEAREAQGEGLSDRHVALDDRIEC